MVSQYLLPFFHQVDIFCQGLGELSFLVLHNLLQLSIKVLRSRWSFGFDASFYERILILGVSETRMYGWWLKKVFLLI
jgi:hypothetical protein